MDLIIISLKTNLFSPWYSWKIAELALNNNNHSYKRVRIQEPYARKFNSLIIASDSRICPDKIDSLKSKPSKR